MTEVERIADQIERAFRGPSWHGPSVMEALEGVTAQIAAQRIIPTAHTIWELMHHIGAWADIPRRRMLGETFEITDDINFPPVVATSEEAWKRSLDKVAESQRKLIEVVRNLDPKRLDDTAVKDGPTIYSLLHGIAQHHTYHAGQITLLKKAG